MSGENKIRVRKQETCSEINEERRFPESRNQVFHLHGNSCRPESTDRVTSERCCNLLRPPVSSDSGNKVLLFCVASDSAGRVRPSYLHNNK